MNTTNMIDHDYCERERERKREVTIVTAIYYLYINIILRQTCVCRNIACYDAI